MSVRKTFGFRVAFGAAAVVTSLAGNAHGSGPTKEQCVKFNEHGQALRDQHQLRSAREQFVACSAQGCPTAVREDCEEQLEKVDSALPSVLISVRSRAGDTLRAVTVRIDGEVVTTRLDEVALAVDPGEHEFSFESVGYAKKSISVRTREGIHDQKVTISLEPNPAPATNSSAPSIEPATASAAPSGPSDESLPPRRVLTYALAGAGAVALGLGVAFGVSAKVRYDDATGPDRCPGGPPNCDARAVDGVHGAYDTATASTALFVIGAALAGAAVVLWLTTPSTSNASLTSWRGAAWRW